MINRRGWRPLLCAALLGAGAFALGTDSKTGKERSLAKLGDEAQNALAAHEYKAARDDFCDILTVDLHNQLALDGAMLAYLQLNDYTRAKFELERSLGLFSHLSRSTAINGAAILVHNKNPMRAAKNLMAYMAPLQNVDEDALNALSVAFWSADEQDRKGRTFAEAVTVYTEDSKNLERDHPGMKRWGNKWVDADEADQKSAAWMAAEKSTANLSRNIATLKSRLASAGQYQDTASLDRLHAELKEKQAEYDKAMAGAEAPPIPASVALVDLTAAPSQAVASTDQPPHGKLPKPVSTPAHPQPSPPPAPDSVATAAPTPPDDRASSPPRNFRITSYAAAFPVGSDLLVTSAEAVDGASELQVQGGDGTPFPATLVRSDPASGLALLRTPTTKFSYLSLADAFSGGSIVCVSFPSVDLFQPTAAQINGKANAPRASWSVRLEETPRLGGGPLLAGGKVVGVELASRDSDIGEIPAATLDDLKKFLGSDAAPYGGVTDGVSVTLQVSATRQP